MALHTKKLYYRRGGTSYSIDLYTTTAEVGAEYVALRDGSTTVYAAAGDVADAAASHLRIQKSGVTKAILTEFVAPQFAFIAIVATQGSGYGEVSFPCGMFRDDASGDIYLADSGNNRVQKFDSNFNFIDEYSTYANNAYLQAPKAVARDSYGNFYVSGLTLQGKPIVKFDSSFNYISALGASGTGDGQFDYAGEVTIDADNNIYCTDLTTGRVQKLNSAGTYLGKITGLNEPNGVTINPYNPSGYLYVADSGNHRIRVYTRTLSYVSQFGSSGSGDGQFTYPCSISFDPLGNIYVVEYLGHRVQVFDSTFNFIGKFGSYGTSGAGGDFWAPRGVTFDQSNNIYVSNQNGHNVQKFAALV